MENMIPEYFQVKATTVISCACGFFLFALRNTNTRLSVVRMIELDDEMIHTIFDHLIMFSNVTCQRTIYTC